MTPDGFNDLFGGSALLQGWSSEFIRTCCDMLVGSSWRMMGETLGEFRTTLGIDRSIRQ